MDGVVAAARRRASRRVELEEVDGLADVGVGFGPVLADFVGEPGAELEFALADDVGGVEQQGDARSTEVAAPGLEARKRGLHRLLSVLRAGLLVNADDLRGAAGLREMILPSVLRRWPPMMRSYSWPSWPAT